MLPIIGSAAIRLFSYITLIPRTVLYPIIAMLCMMGVYGFNSSEMDLWIMLIFGIIGYGMRKLDFPLAPMMIGFVLLPLGEQSVRQALTISSGKWSIFISTPISVTFLLATILSISFIAYRSFNTP